MAQKAKATQRSWNPVRKARQAANWLKSQKRKRERDAQAKAAQKRNASLREQGLPTPWERAQNARGKKS